MFIDYSRKLACTLLILMIGVVLHSGNYKVIYPEEKKQENKDVFKIAGKISDTNGPIEFAKIEILETDMVVHSKKNGTFIIPFFPSWGKYIVEVTKTGYEPYRHYLDISKSVTVVISPILFKINEYWEGIEFIESIPMFIESYEELEGRYPSLPLLEYIKRSNKFHYPGFYPKKGNIRFRNFPYPAIYFLIFEDLKQGVVLNLRTPGCEMYPNWYRDEKIVYNIAPGKHYISFYDEKIKKIASKEIEIFEEKTTIIDFNFLKHE